MRARPANPPFQPLAVYVLVAGSLATGCVSHTRIAYPDSWPALVPATAECPNIAGRYVNLGSLAPGDHSFCHETKGRKRLSWHCDVDLAYNIGDIGSGNWVELRQPDADTLVVISTDPREDVRTWHRSAGDFSCGTGGLRRHQHANSYSLGGDEAHPDSSITEFNTAAGAFNAATASTGLRTLTRSFNPAADGSLVMSVIMEDARVEFGFPSSEKDSTFVRWERAPLDTVGPTGAETGHGPNQPAPAELVARFQFRRGWFTDTSLSTVDGRLVETHLFTNPLPQVFPAGKHWIVLDVKGGSLIPPMDRYANYGFMLEAVAGHTYSLSEQPGTCYPPKGKGHLLPIIYRRKLTILDGVMGRSVGRLVVDALCTLGPVSLCPPDGLPSDFEPGTCVKPEDSEWGFWGVEASKH